MSQRVREPARSRTPERRNQAAEESDAALPLTYRQRLAPARGVLLGLVIAAVLWALLGLAVLAWRSLYI